MAAAQPVRKKEEPALAPLAEPLSDAEARRRAGFVASPPTILQIETTSICNFRCGSCPLSLPGYDRPGRHMDLATFERLLDAFPATRKIELQGVGEVFLNPCAPHLVAAAKRRGIEVHSFSNASNLEPALARAVVESGIDALNFSLDGADEATFRELRRGGTLARYRQCVGNVLAARAATGLARPAIGMICVLSTRNFRQAPAMIALAEELGLDTVILTKITSSANHDLDAILLGEAERAWLDAMPPHAGRTQVIRAWTPWTRDERVGCHWPTSQAYITVEGDVTPCCHFFDQREASLGNALSKPGEQIWNDDAYRAFRRRLWSGDLPEKCKRC